MFSHKNSLFNTGWKYLSLEKYNEKENITFSDELNWKCEKSRVNELTLDMSNV